MRSIDLSLPFNWLARMLTSVSVRTRIVVLAVIPVAGFLANGITYTAGEGDVGRAFATVTQSTALADASRDFKSAVAAMRLVVKDFSVSPNNDLVIIFDESHGLALKALDSISGAIDQTRAENIVSMRKDVTALRKNFDDLVREQKILGFDDASGLRGNLHDSGQRGRAHHQREHVVAGEGRRHEVNDVAALHAALRGRIPGRPGRSRAAAISSEASRNLPTPLPTSTARRR